MGGVGSQAYVLIYTQRSCIVSDPGPVVTHNIRRIPAPDPVVNQYVRPKLAPGPVVIRRVRPKLALDPVIIFSRTQAGLQA